MDKGKDVSAIMFVKSKGVLLHLFFHGRWCIHAWKLKLSPSFGSHVSCLISLPKKQILIAFENNKILIEMITNMFFVS